MIRAKKAGGNIYVYMNIYRFNFFLSWDLHDAMKKTTRTNCNKYCTRSNKSEKKVKPKPNTIGLIFGYRVDINL